MIKKYFIVLSASLLILNPCHLQAQDKDQRDPLKDPLKDIPTQTLDNISQVKPLTAFGYDIFQKTAEPITEGPVDDQYILSPGDEVIIAVWGQLSLNYPLTVSEDGFITLSEEAGRIFTNGVSLKELKGKITESLSRIYSSYIDPQNPSKSTAFIDVKLSKARKILVYVVGEVNNQGAYTINSGVATLLNLLINAGGVKETGSLREIKIRRADGTIDSIDLYDFLLSGKIDPKKTQVRYGDYIIVPVKAKSVTIRGEVKRAGIYEAIGNEGIKDLIRFAGALTPNAYHRRIQIRRYEINTGEKYIDLDLERIFSDSSKDITLADGDTVTIFPNIVPRRPLVEIYGSGVKRPGVYQFTPGMTLKDLMERAEGLADEVYLNRADLIRTMDDLSKRMTIFSLQDLYKQGQTGQYVFSGSTDKNFALRELDVIMTYSSFEMKGGDKKVSLYGYVKEPGTYTLPDNMTLFDFIFSRGGFQNEEFKKGASLDLAHIFRKKAGEINERLISFNLAKLLEGAPSENEKLESGDRIIIYAYETMKTRPFVSIEGLVKRPAIYNLAENMTLEDLILVAGGLRPDAYKAEAVIARAAKGNKSGDNPQEIKRDATIIVPVDKDYALLPKEKRTQLESYDKVVIRNLPEWEPLSIVTLEGQIVYPGSYSLESKEERISNIIKRGGGLKKDGLPEGAILHRRKNIIEMALGDQTASEKVAINLKDALNNPGGSSDLILKDGDRIFVPNNPDTVNVRGAVKNPLIFQYKKGKSLGYYIDLAGGYTKEADKSGTVVYHPNGMAARSGFLSGPEVLSGSVVEVPFKGEGKEIELVEVRGGIKNPTLIQFRKGENLNYYVDLCGGYREDADLENIAISQQDGTILERLGIPLFNPNITSGSIIEVPFKAKEKTMEEEKAKGGDVEVRGAVMNPGVIRYRKDTKMDYYISFCGGYKENADTNKIIVHMPTGKVIEKSLIDKAGEKATAAQLPEGWVMDRTGIKNFSPDIMPGCVIEVPTKEIKK